MKHYRAIAPKERINIVYQQGGDDPVQVELPLKILVMGNYLGETDTTPIEDRKPININKDNFSRVMQECQLSLNLSVKNRLKDQSDQEIPLELRFEALSDFGPQAIAENCPELNALLELRDALTALKGPLGNIPAFRQRLRELMQNQECRSQLVQELQHQNALPSSAS